MTAGRAKTAAAPSLREDVLSFLHNLADDAGTYEPTEQDAACLEKEGMEELICKKLTSKNFRKWKLPAGAEERLRRAVAHHVARGTPIKLVFEFGGYKLWRLPAGPETDWAEYFTIAHFVRYAAPVAALYPPGIRVCFASDDVVVERMNNIPKSATEAYARSFRALAAHFNARLPDNLRVEFVRLADLSDSPEALEAELEKTYAATRAAFPDWSQEKKDKLLGRARLNFCPTTAGGGRDLSHLTPEEVDEAHLNGAVWHDAFEATAKRAEFVKGEDSVLIFTTPIPEAIPIGVTKASVTKFWTGIGMLEKTDAGFRDIILSPRQIERLPNLVPECDIEEIETDLFPDLAHYKTIRLSHRPLNFSLKDTP